MKSGNQRFHLPCTYLCNLLFSRFLNNVLMRDVANFNAYCMKKKKINLNCWIVNWNQRWKTAISYYLLIVLDVWKNETFLLKAKLLLSKEAIYSLMYFRISEFFLEKFHLRIFRNDISFRSKTWYLMPLYNDNYSKVSSLYYIFSIER